MKIIDEYILFVYNVDETKPCHLRSYALATICVFISCVVRDVCKIDKYHNGLDTVPCMVTLVTRCWICMQVDCLLLALQVNLQKAMQCLFISLNSQIGLN